MLMVVTDSLRISEKLGVVGAVEKCSQASHLGNVDPVLLLDLPSF